jgi:ParB family chromosome partitioning protein
MVKRQSLGRGFEALIPKDLDSTILEEDKHRVQKLLINDVVPNPDQPRKQIDKAALDEMTQSVKQHGILQPIVVVRSKDRYRIVAGERRWRAAKAARLSHIPAIVRNLEELEQIELALIENIQRQDLPPLDQALSVYKLQQQFNLSLEEVANKLGKAPSTISNLTRLLQLPTSAREALHSGQISEGHARAILALKYKPKLQEELLSYILNNTWSVRQAEQFVLTHKKSDRPESSHELDPNEARLTSALSKQLGVPVKIRHTAKTVQLIISFDSQQQLDKIIEKIEKSPNKYE